VPGSGLYAELAQRFPQQAAAKNEEPWPVKILWTELDGEDFFMIDAATGCLLLNTRYREKVLAGLPPHSEDVPLVKVLLFLLLQHDLNVSRPSDKRRRELARINQLLATAAGLGEG
jgi:hypothetical protein